MQASSSEQDRNAQEDALKETEAQETSSQYLPVIQENARTINELLDISCRRYRELPAIGMALEDPLSYKGMHQQVLSLAALLRKGGLERDARLAILSENSHRWGLIYLAAVRLGAVVVPIFPDLPESDVRHILKEMKCDTIFLTQRQIEKIYDVKQQLQTVVTIDDYLDDTGLVPLRPFSAFLAEALEEFGEAAAREELDFPELTSDDLASILYTSGTSGFSKAVLLSHGNFCANTSSANGLIELQPQMVFLSVLPISHTYEFTVGFLLPLMNGCRIVYAGKTPTPAVLQRICAREQPHLILAVPLIIEKIFKKRIMPAVEKSAMLRFLCRFNVSRKMIYRKAGAKLKAFFGERLHLMGIGGAALNPEVESFLRDANFPFLVGYGLTESSPLLAGGPYGDGTIPLGSTGKAVPQVELRIDDPDPESGIGELLARGRNVMRGYYNDEEATKNSFTEDGWLRTGDLGTMDAEGNLFIKGRSKSLIVLSNGENVHPEVIEHKINAYPFVVESLVTENHGQLEAWVYPDYEFVDEKTTGQSPSKRHQYLAELLEKMRLDVNTEMTVSSRLSRVIERRDPFIKTATHKIKRYLYTTDDVPLVHRKQEK